MTARLLLTWGIATAVGLLVALTTRIGPVVVRLPGHSHGLHVGDVVGLVLCWGVATVVTVLALLSAADPRP